MARVRDKDTIHDDIGKRAMVPAGTGRRGGRKRFPRAGNRFTFRSFGRKGARGMPVRDAAMHERFATRKGRRRSRRGARVSRR